MSYGLKASSYDPLKVKSDIMQHLSNRQGVFLVLLGLSAAFDTVNHSVLLNRLTNDIGVGGAVLKWFESYLTGRTTRVCINGTFSEPHNLQYGLPQGSMVGPLSFTIYTCPIWLIIKKYSLDYHIYADDIQLYVTFCPTDPNSTNAALSWLSSCITEIQNWMTKNYLKLNQEKTEFFIAASSHHMQNVTPVLLKVGNESVRAYSC